VIVAHIIGIPVEESALALATAGAAMLAAIAGWLRRRGERMR
jgi:LPXTG-motif cell wall-anchored protein